MQDDTSFGYGRTESLSTNGRATPAPAVVAEVTTPGITVEQYADYVKLPQNYLRGDLGLTDVTYDFNPAVRMMYQGSTAMRPTTASGSP
jgi:hypothetical protein